MTHPNDILLEAKKLRLLAAALELQHLTSTAANVVLIPGGDRVIAIGTRAEVARASQVHPESALPSLPAGATGSALDNLPRAIGVGRDAESPGGKGVFVAFERPLTDDELRTLHDALARRATQQAMPLSSNPTGLSSNLVAGTGDADERALRWESKCTAIWSDLRRMIEQHTGKPCDGELLDAIDELLSSAALAKQAAAKPSDRQPLNVPGADGAAKLPLTYVGKSGDDHVWSAAPISSPIGERDPDECGANMNGHRFGPHGINGEQQCQWCGERAPIGEQGEMAGEVAPPTIDTAEFRRLSFAYAEALFKGTVPETSAAWGALVEHVDARAPAHTAAVAGQDARDAGSILQSQP